MSFDALFAPMSVSASGLSAERLRMEVVANNIANAFTTRTPEGGPFRRQDLVFASVLVDRLKDGQRVQEMGGVEVVELIDDPSELPRVLNPGHPDADAQGYVLMPNVQVPLELVNLVTASRAYEANLKVLQAFRAQAELAFSLLGG